MPSKQASIYLREASFERLGAGDQGLSLRIAAVLARYEQLVQALLPSLTRAEWCAIMDANNPGTDLWVAEGDHPSGSLIWANVHDSPELGAKWEIDQRQLVERLQQLSPAELLAVDEAVARFWNHHELETDEALARAWIVPSDQDGPD